MPLGLLHLTPSGGFRPIQPMTAAVGGAVISAPVCSRFRCVMSRVGGQSIVLKGKIQQPRPQRPANRRSFGSLPKPRGVPPMTRFGPLIGMVHIVSASS